MNYPAQLQYTKHHLWVKMEEESLAMQAKRLIEEEFPYLDGVEDLADRIAVSKCHLIRCFSREFGISPGQYLIRTRVDAARKYLLEREYSVEMIAGLVGFSNGNYFCKVFRRLNGISPGEYRRTSPASASRGEIPGEDKTYM